MAGQKMQTGSWMDYLPSFGGAMPTRDMGAGARLAANPVAVAPPSTGGGGGWGADPAPGLMERIFPTAVQTMQDGRAEMQQYLNQGNKSAAAGAAARMFPQAMWGGATDAGSKIIDPVFQSVGDFTRGAVGADLATPMLTPDATQAAPAAKLLKISPGPMPPTMYTSPPRSVPASEKAYNAMVKANGGKALPAFMLMDIAKVRPEKTPAAPPGIKDQVGQLLLQKMAAETQQFMASNPTPEASAQWNANMQKNLMSMFGVDPLKQMMSQTPDEE